MLKITTSWDDGDILDKRLSALLYKYGFRGTFYLAKNFRQNHLSNTDIIDLSTKYEIGAHTLNHPDLRTLSKDEQRNEILGSKIWLEKILNLPVRMFCYPKGLYNDSAISVVKDAGFIGARGIELGSVSLPSNKFKMESTIQIYPFPLRRFNKDKYYWTKLFEPYNQRAPKLKQMGISILSMTSWLSMAKATFDFALKGGDVFHIIGHSWEIEKYNIWKDLEYFFQYASNRPNCLYVPNSELLDNNFL